MHHYMIFDDAMLCIILLLSFVFYIQLDTFTKYMLFFFIILTTAAVGITRMRYHQSVVCVCLCVDKRLGLRYRVTWKILIFLDANYFICNRDCMFM